MSDLQQNLQGKAPYAESSLRQADFRQSKEGGFQPHLSTPANPTALASIVANPWIFPGHVASNLALVSPSPFAPFTASRYPRPLTPLKSPLDRSKQDMLSDRDAREVSPLGAPVIKQEELTLPQRITWFKNHLPKKDPVVAILRSKCRLILFETLERLCTHAGRYYSRREHDQPWSPGSRTNHSPFLSTPSICSTQQSIPPATAPRNYIINSRHQQSLLDYISCINTALWSTASHVSDDLPLRKTTSRTANSEFYIPGPRMLSQTGNSQQRVLSDEEVFGVVMSARDLVSWCLCEKEKAEIERLWAEWVERR
ncbi:MAG: hypothetical protein M1835_001190 [Candelina submexicana]|nr:MAG: hypothetical protein M1835_001190 [Candelina submexicana]